MVFLHILLSRSMQVHVLIHLQFFQENNLYSYLGSLYTYMFKSKALYCTRQTHCHIAGFPPLLSHSLVFKEVRGQMHFLTTSWSFFTDFGNPWIKWDHIWLIQMTWQTSPLYLAVWLTVYLIVLFNIATIILNT